jgi:hypothetical protein
MNWLDEHQADADIDEPLLVPEGGTVRSLCSPLTQLSAYRPEHKREPCFSEQHQSTTDVCAAG